MRSTVVLFIAALSVLARPAPQAQQSFTKQNGIDAINMNNQFASLTPDSPCSAGQDACVNQQFAQCVSGSFVLQPCAAGTICAALPLVNSAGTVGFSNLYLFEASTNETVQTIACTTQSDLNSRLAATGATDNSQTASSSSSAPASTSTSTGSSSNDSNNSGNNSGDLQTSLCLDPSLVQTGFEQNGQETPEAGQVASLTSSNNFINFCATVPNLPLTNGAQVKGGSCNGAPMGIIASVNNMPSAKFVFPTNFATIKANVSFTVQMAIQHLSTGNFVNADANYFSAPQQIDSNGDITGHSHIVIEAIPSFTSTQPTNPGTFAFFKGLNDAAVNGILTANVTDGLGPGTYRMASINTAANHQPVLVPIAQHGTLDDMIYFTVTEDGQPNNSNNASGNGNGHHHHSTSATGNNNAVQVSTSNEPAATSSS